MTNDPRLNVSGAAMLDNRRTAADIVSAMTRELAFGLLLLT